MILDPQALIILLHKLIITILITSCAPDTPYCDETNLGEEIENEDGCNSCFCGELNGKYQWTCTKKDCDPFFPK